VIPTTYYVWRRHSSSPELDGYVNATCYDPNFAPGCKADESYDVLLVTEDWDGEAKPLIEREQKAA
jgi:hypothetical protein